MAPALATRFAPAERLDRTAVTAQSTQVADQEYVRELLQAFSSIALVLNPERQVVLANPALFNALGTDLDSVLGNRPGELVGCVHSTTEPGGCGTSEACRYCGAIGAILSCQESGSPASSECRILARQKGCEVALDLRVTVTPLRVNDSQYTVVELADISDTKRRQALERIFFHDVINTAGLVEGFAHLLASQTTPPAARDDVLRHLLESSRQLTGEILMQRQLSQAESGELAVKPGPIVMRHALEGVASGYRAHVLGKGRILAVTPVDPGLTIVTDPNLLDRVLGNLVKNALEATAAGGTVGLSAGAAEGKVLITVSNPGVMPPEVRAQVFQRSFSTKGAGRGLGTYSIKLLVERYLGGTVDFTSREAAGTVFVVRLPLAGPGPARPGSR